MQCGVVRCRQHRHPGTACGASAPFTIRTLYARCMHVCPGPPAVPVRVKERERPLPPMRIHETASTGAAADIDTSSLLLLLLLRPLQGGNPSDDAIKASPDGAGARCPSDIRYTRQARRGVVPSGSGAISSPLRRIVGDPWRPWWRASASVSTRISWIGAVIRSAARALLTSTTACSYVGHPSKESTSLVRPLDATDWPADRVTQKARRDTMHSADANLRA